MKIQLKIFFFFFIRKLFNIIIIILITIQLDLTMVAHFRPLPMNENKQYHTSHHKQLNYYYCTTFLDPKSYFVSQDINSSKTGFVDTSRK